MARTKTRLLLTGDYEDRLNALYAAALEARDDDSQRTLAEGDPYSDLVEQYQTLKAEAEANGVRVVLQDPGRKKFRDMKAKHPPRTDESVPEDSRKADERAGFNIAAAEDDVLYITVVEPEFTSRAAFDEWVDELGEGEFQTLLADAWGLLTGARFDPKALPPSRTRSNDES